MKKGSQPIFKRCGSPGYVAPEIYFYRDGSEFYDEKCDVFSLGIIMYSIIVPLPLPNPL